MKKFKKLVLAGMFSLFAIGCATAVCTSSGRLNEPLAAQAAEKSSCSVKFGSIGYWYNTTTTKNGNEVQIWMNMGHTYITNIGCTSFQSINSVELKLKDGCNAKYTIDIGSEKHYFTIKSDSYMDVKNLTINYNCQ